MAEVFISYSPSDRGLVAPIAAALAELGVDAWFDREILAGESFGAIIRARLSERLAAESAAGRRLQDEITALRNAQEQTKTETDNLETARKQIVRLSDELAYLKAKGSTTYAQQLPILDLLLAAYGSIFVYFGVISIFGATNYIHPILTVISIILILLVGYCVSPLPIITDTNARLMVFIKYVLFHNLPIISSVMPSNFFI